MILVTGGLGMIGALDQLATKYTGAPYPRGQERIVAVIEPERQTVGISGSAENGS